MKIGLYNLEPKYINIALEKAKLYHEERGDTVERFMPLDTYDRVYASSIFTWSDKSYVPEDAMTGGTGFDLETKLPADIEAMKPKINVGFTTRGCVRKCSFCVVPKTEGRLRATGDIYDFWDGRTRDVRILDNNILGLKEHFLMIAGQLKKEALKVEFDALDIRLVTPEIARILAGLRFHEYRFAFDQMGDERFVRKGIALLKDAGIKRSTFYVLVGFNTTLEEDLERLNILRGLGQNAFVQRYNLTREKKYIPLARWANQHRIFQGMTYKDFLGKEYG